MQTTVTRIYTVDSLFDLSDQELFNSALQAADAVTIAREEIFSALTAAEAANVPLSHEGALAICELHDTLVVLFADLASVLGIKVHLLGIVEATADIVSLLAAAEPVVFHVADRVESGDLTIVQGEVF